MRILDSNNIKYKEYVLDIKEALDGVTCAKMLNVNIDSTFKTLVTVGKSGNYYVFVIPVDKKLDLKKAACSVNEKNIEMLPMKNLLAITGYVHGGCSPIGMKKVLNTVIDKSALLFNKIIFSGGKIGYFIEIDVKDIVKVLNVKYDDLVG
ncbi:MAG: aminoacyl-tRNA deacylase [Bacilli bacterium]|nr:aminoacyl-tRNA deacylase [Bacilli bacterium]